MTRLTINMDWAELQSAQESPPPPCPEHEFREPALPDKPRDQPRPNPPRYAHSLWSELEGIIKPHILAQYRLRHREDPKQLHRDMDALYEQLHALPGTDEPEVQRRRDELRARLRELQEREAGGIEDRFLVECALKPGYGYEALALASSLLDQYAHLTAKNPSGSDPKR